MKPLPCIIIILSSFACSKKNTPPAPVNPVINTPVYPAPADPATAATVGFFGNGWKPKTFVKPQAIATTMAALPAAATVTVDAAKIVAKISPAVFGQNHVSYKESLADKEPVATHLQAINPGIIRFPGGSISDTYFWNRNFQDKPADAPNLMMNEKGVEENWQWNYFYGKGNDQSARANLDDYYALLQKTGSEGMITVNYAYARYGLSANPVAAAAHLAADWVRYDNGRTKYWEIGNENHGGWEKGYRINTANNKDGQPEYISGALYAAHARVFIDSMKKAAAEVGKAIYIGAGVLETAPSAWLVSASRAAADWNKNVFTALAAAPVDYYIIHSYYTGFDGVTAPDILNSATTATPDMASYVTAQMAQYGSPVKPIAMTEYNIFARGEKQQVSFINGMHTALVIAEAVKHNYGAAVRWDIVNGWQTDAGYPGTDHGLFDSGDEPAGKKWNPRPVFYYLYYMQKTMGDRMLAAASNNDGMAGYASSFTSGEKAVMLVNKTAAATCTNIVINNAAIGKKIYWYVLSGGTDNGSFSQSVLINNTGPDAGKTGGPADYSAVKAYVADINGDIKINVPPRSVVYAVVDKP